MADVFSKSKRSLVMSRIRGRGNKDTEGALAALLRRNRIFGWRRHPTIFGNPDFVFLKLRLIIFVDGCFWHGCPRHATQPKNNAAFWSKKLAGNRVRDRLVSRTLRARGWTVMRIWEHELSKKNQPRLLRRLRRLVPKVDREERCSPPTDAEDRSEVYAVNREGPAKGSCHES